MKHAAKFWIATAAIELRAAGWCRREAAKAPSPRLRQGEIHEARNRITEARYARLSAQMMTARPPKSAQ